MQFVLLMLIVHFPVYWLPPGGKQRYILMLYPFIIQILTYFFLIYYKSDRSKSKFTNVLITVAVGLGAIACLVPLVNSQPVYGSLLLVTSTIAFLLLLAIFINQTKKPGMAIISLILTMIILRYVFAMAVLPVRATQGRAPENKAAALKIAEMTNKKDVCVLSPTYFPMQSTFYFEKETSTVLPRCNNVGPEQFYILEKFLLAPYSYYREENMKVYIPSINDSDPFTGGDKILFPEDFYRVHLEFVLQKTEYLLIGPVHPRP